VRDTLSQNPICQVCKEPMEKVHILKARKDSEEVEVTVFMCYEDVTFERTVKGVK